MRKVAAGVGVALLLLAGCGGGYEHPVLVQTEEEGAADAVRYVLLEALSGDVFSACSTDSAGTRDEVCVDLVRDVRSDETFSRDARIDAETVQVDASMITAAEDRLGLQVPRAAITVPDRTADRLAGITHFTVGGPTDRYVEFRTDPG